MRWHLCEVPGQRSCRYAGSAPYLLATSNSNGLDVPFWINWHGWSSSVQACDELRLVSEVAFTPPERDTGLVPRAWKYGIFTFRSVHGEEVQRFMVCVYQSEGHYNMSALMLNALPNDFWSQIAPIPPRLLSRVSFSNSIASSASYSIDEPVPPCSNSISRPRLQPFPKSYPR